MHQIHAPPNKHPCHAGPPAAFRCGKSISRPPARIQAVASYAILFIFNLFRPACQHDQRAGPNRPAPDKSITVFGIVTRRILAAVSAGIFTCVPARVFARIAGFVIACILAVITSIIACLVGICFIKLI